MERSYTVIVSSSDLYDSMESLLTTPGTTDSLVPSRAVTQTDSKPHSSTRATYLLTDDEAQLLRQHPSVLAVHLDMTVYPEIYAVPPENISLANRYNDPVLNYRGTIAVPGVDPASITQLNRAGWQLLRTATYNNAWRTATSTVVTSNIPYTRTGVDVDVILGDDGCWFGHSEFQNNTGSGPTLYQGGNVLPGNGTCDLLDLVLEAPYYIDPAWFNANPATRLDTRWDGTVVPNQVVAREWWQNSTKRSAQFAAFGNIPISNTYSRGSCNGTNDARPSTGVADHGTPCAGQLYGRTFGWAFNANKWHINLYGANGVGFEIYFDILKIFHQYKPVNPTRSTRDPSICSNSWGIQIPGVVLTPGYYYYRVGTSGQGGVAFTTRPNFLQTLGARIIPEILPNAATQSAAEAIEAGVIMVMAAGNSNQLLVNAGEADYDNYVSIEANTALADTVRDYFGYLYLTTLSRRGYPSQSGAQQVGSNILYPCISVGALDWQTTSGQIMSGLERRVDYSMTGSAVDFFSVGDQTLSASARVPSAINTRPRYDNTYPGAGLTSVDQIFDGTSSACPTACGFLATLLETNRSWTWEDIKNWIQTLRVQSPSTFYIGPVPTSANDPAWLDKNSLWGAPARVLYNNSDDPPPVIVSVQGILNLAGNIQMRVA